MRLSVRNLLLSVWMTASGYVAGAQTILEPQLPSQGLIQQAQLWNILVINNGEPLQGAVLQLSFQEDGSGRKIFTATTAALFIPSGVSQLSSRDVGSVHYDYLSSGIDMTSSGGLLPMGRFIACYSLMSNGAKGIQAISQDCLPVTVEPFAPPQLAYPENQSDITTDYPVFNWLAPAPAAMFTDLKYKIVLTEVKKGQRPADAIQRNPILFFRDGLRDPTLVYPSSYVALQKGKTYAWQVIASNGNAYSAATEIWSFNYKNDSVSIVLDNASYPHLQRGAGSGHFIVHEKIKFSYENEAGDSVLPVHVYQYNRQGNIALIERKVKLQRGLNFLDFDLGKGDRLDKGKEYVLEIVNGRKENWDLRFRYEPLNQ
jgi:hypothetical protein